MGTKVKPQTLKYVSKVGCSNDCDNVLEINQGLPLPCKEWTNDESRLLRERMLVDNQLFESGFVRRVEGSTLGNSRRIKMHGIDVGTIRTQSNGAAAVNECKTTYDGLKMKDYEKKFYIVNTEKNIELCTKEFIGTQWQDLISGQLSEYEAQQFENTDLADLIISRIIEEFNRFVPEFMLMATCDGSGENQHGDDGILAKAYYASKGQYFHTLEYDFSGVLSAITTPYINAIIGGRKYDKAPTDFATAQQYALDFVDWINEQKDKRVYLFNASLDLSGQKLYVASNIAIRFIDLRIVLNDGSALDWGCKSTTAAELVATQLQKPMMINDVPLIFQYENIDENNFAQKFKEYKKEFKRYLHRNGWAELTDADLLIGIDPELLLERDAQTQNAYINGNFNPEFMDEIGLSQSQFVALNALNDTGLFFMTIRQNLLLLDDASNSDNTMLNMGRMRIKEACDTAGLVHILGNTPPIGSEVEAWGAFASNLAGSFFVIDNKLDDREPCENAKLNLICYDDNVKNDCLIEATCSISCSVETEIVYDGGLNQTVITVTINSNTPVGTTLVYDIDWALSDGTSGTATAQSFTITLPEDLTDEGLVLSVTGTIEAQLGGDAQCKTYVNYSEKFGSGEGYALCSATLSHDNAGTPVTTQLSVSYDIDGINYDIALVDTLLDLSNPADFAAIETEMEAILSGAAVTITDSAPNVDFDVQDLPSFITNVVVNSAGSGNSTAAMTITC